MYATFRNFIGIKGDKMFTISGKTTSNNYIFGCEFINKIQPTLELDDCIGIDGGGSFFHRDKGRFISRTLENRPINNIITF